MTDAARVAADPPHQSQQLLGAPRARPFSGKANTVTNQTPPSRAQIAEICCRLISEVSGVDLPRITSDSNMLTDLAMDNLDTVELAMAIEEEFDIMLKDEDIEETQTVSQLIDVVERATLVAA